MSFPLKVSQAALPALYEVLRYRHKHSLGRVPVRGECLESEDHRAKVTFMFPSVEMRTQWLTNLGWDAEVVGYDPEDILVPMVSTQVWAPHAVFELVRSQDFASMIEDESSWLQTLSVVPFTVSEALSMTEGSGGRATHIVTHPKGFSHLRCMGEFFDPETRKSQLQQGVMGHLFGAQVLVSHWLPPNVLVILNLHGVDPGQMPDPSRVAQIRMVP